VEQQDEIDRLMKKMVGMEKEQDKMQMLSNVRDVKSSAINGDGVRVNSA